MEKKKCTQKQGYCIEKYFCNIRKINKKYEGKRAETFEDNSTVKTDVDRGIFSSKFIKYIVYFEYL